MSILNFEPVTRRGMRFIVCLYGLSETGKTLSALKLMAGMEPDPKKRALIDSEGGQRGRAYVDHIDGGYIYGRLTPPFTPERFTEAVREAESYGASTLVVDSGSHVWFGEGGVLDMVDDQAGTNEFAKYKKPKRRLNKFTQAILQSDMNIILCLRGKHSWLDVVVDGKKQKVQGPVVPVMDKSLWFDLSIVIQMLGDGKFDISRPAGKCPGALRDFFATAQLINEEMGRNMMKWCGEQGGKSPEQRLLESNFQAAAELGKKGFEAFTKTLTDDQRKMLEPMKANMWSVAKAADLEAEERAKEAKEREIDLADPFGATTDPATAKKDEDDFPGTFPPAKTVTSNG